MFRALLAFVLLFTLPAASLAAPPSDEGKEPPQEHKWWQGQPARDLGVTAEQSARIEAIYQAAFPRFQAAMQDAETAQNELNKLIAGEKTTEVEVVRQLGKAQAARNEANRQFTLMLFRFNQELSPEQRQKVKAMFDARRERDRRGGRRGDVPPRRETRK